MFRTRMLVSRIGGAGATKITELVERVRGMLV
jgi:hypothetical protein